VTTVVDASVVLRWCFQLKGSGRAEQLFRSNDRFILVMAEITNAAWKFVLFDGVTAESAQTAVRDVAKAF
jgi:predicted nucleic acid-binding protein